MIKEPYIKISEEVISSNLNSNVDDTAILAGAVVSPAGGALNYITSPSEFLKKMVGSTSLPRNAHVSLVNAYYCSFFAPLLLSRVLNTDAVSRLNVPVGTSTMTTQKVLNGVTMNAKVTSTPDSTTFGTGKAALFAVDNVVFYNANCKLHVTDSAGEDLGFTYLDVIMDQYPRLKNYVRREMTPSEITEWLTNSSSYVLDGTISASCEWNALYHSEMSQPEVPYDILSVYGTVDEAHSLSAFLADLTDDSAEETKKVASTTSSESTDIVNGLTLTAHDPNSANVYSVTIVPHGNTSDMELKIYKGSTALVNGTYSTNPDSTDLEGNNNFIENVNLIQDDFTLKVVGTVPEGAFGTAVKTGVFGNSDVSTMFTATPEQISAAISRLGDQEDYVISHLDLFGVTTASVVNRAITLANEIHAFCPSNLPLTYGSASACNQYASGITSSNQSMVMGPFDKNNSFLGYYTNIACTSLYWEKVYANRRASKEWASCFYSTNGTLNFTNPTVKFGKSDRELLLNGSAGPVVFTIYDKQDNKYYLNMPSCHSNDGDLLCEEQWRRLANRIYQAEKQLMKQFIGRLNTVSTRAQVTAVLENWISNNIMNQRVTPNAFKVICDKSNNTEAVINAGKLAVQVKVQLLPSVKYIEITNSYYDLNSEF